MFLFLRETEWAFGTPEGRQFLAGEAGVDRLAVVTLNRGHKFNSLEEVKAELSPIISDFSPVTNKVRQSVIQDLCSPAGVHA